MDKWYCVPTSLSTNKDNCITKYVVLYPIHYNQKETTNKIINKCRSRVRSKLAKKIHAEMYKIMTPGPL